MRKMPSAKICAVNKSNLSRGNVRMNGVGMTERIVLHVDDSGGVESGWDWDVG